MTLYTKIIDIQKLDEGLQKVVKNKPAAGGDGITYNMFQDNKKEYLEQLHLELAEHRYHPQPVKLVKFYRGEKERTVALYSMRDKTLQQSIATELQKIYEPLFSKVCYAYRSGRSAIEAVGKIQWYMADKGGWVLKMDIHAFFDSILQCKLQQELQHTIKEQAVVELIMENASAKSLESNGKIIRKPEGIWHGSNIAPILSNIYLKDFDYEMEQKASFFVRYCDDMLVMTENKDKARELLQFTKVYMEKRGLILNEDKMMLAPVEQGVNFLGYHFNSSGKRIPVKAERNLQTRLEDLFMASLNLSIRERLKKGAEILQGWEQYYRSQREIHSIWEYAVVLYMVQNKGDKIQEKIWDMRPLFRNNYRELTKYMAELWKQNGRIDLQLLEYEQLYELDEIDQYCIKDYSSPFVQELLSRYEKLTAYEDQDILAEMIQDYIDLKCLNKAFSLMERYQRMKNTEYELPSNPPVQIEPSSLILSDETRQLFYKLFVGREDTYSEEHMFRKMIVSQKKEPLTDEILKEHLSATRTIGTYAQRPNGTAKYLVIDIDISKKILLKYSVESGEMEQYRKLCFHISCNILKVLEKLGLKGYIENSGFRGYHIWIFFTEWIPVRHINALSQIITEKSQDILEEEINIEYFPNECRIRREKAGTSIRLPLGINSKSGQRGYFLNENFEIITELTSFFKDIAKFSLAAVRKIIAMYAGDKKMVSSLLLKKYTLDQNLEDFGRLSDEVRTVLEQCSLMRYLCQKARKTGYLTHFERLSVLNVFGHMGDGGKEFLHQIMEYTLNYQYQITQKFINRIPEKPVSCMKLQEQYYQITAQIGCSCNFKRTKNCYPSPVLHALKSVDTERGQITVPSSRNLSKEKEQMVYQEVNVYRKVQELTENILEMKRQKWAIDKKMAKIEKELESIFDGMKIDCLEIDMGLLCRKEKENGKYEWVIEI